VLCPELRRPGVRRRWLRQYGHLRQLQERPDLRRGERAVSGAGDLLPGDLSQRLLWPKRHLSTGEYGASLWHGRGGVRELFRIEVDVPERDVRLHPAVPGQGLRRRRLRRNVRDVFVRPNLPDPERPMQACAVHAADLPHRLLRRQRAMPAGHGERGLWHERGRLRRLQPRADLLQWGVHRALL
jgi:hypothetical protein